MKGQKHWLGVFCDLLTISRIFFGLGIGLSGPYLGPASSRIVLTLLLAGWSTDILDGHIARAINKPKTWIGENEILFDSFMIMGTVSYLSYTHFLPIWMGVAYNTILFILVISRASYAKIFPVESLGAIATIPLLIYAEETLFSMYIVVIWGTVALVYDWPRAMTLARIWKKTLIAKSQALEQISPRNVSLVGLLLSIPLLAISLALKRAELLGVTVALIFFCGYHLWES